MLRRWAAGAVLGTVAALTVPAASHAAATVAKTGAEWRYTAADGQANAVRVGRRDGSAGSPIVFLDASIPATAPCTDYIYDPPDLPPFFTPPPRKVGVQCPFDATTETARAVMKDGNDFASGVSAFFCGSFFSGEPCIVPLPRPLAFEGGDGDDTLVGGTSEADLDGHEGDDQLTGGSGPDTLDGGPGRDVLAGRAGADDLRGGAGIDEVSYAYTAQRVIVSLDDQPNDGEVNPAPTEGDNVKGDIENVTGGDGPDIFSGSDAANTFTGGAGDDQLTGRGGFDAYYGQSGADSIFARDGNRERVDCGDDADFAELDSSDTVSGCEAEERSDALEGDLDRDGFREPADCNDRDAAVRPDATDAPDNGLDENCDGADATIRDRDGDGFTPPADCDDANAAHKPGAREVFGDDEDEDCNGRADPLQTISSFVRSGFRAAERRTFVSRFRAVAVRAGTTVRVTCRGRGRGRRRGCRFAAQEFPVTRDQKELDLRRPLRLRGLRPGTRLEVFFLREDSLIKRQTFVTRRGKLPRTSVRCARPDTSRFRACP